MKRIKVNVNGKEVEGILIENIKKKLKRKVKKNKTYEWEEYFAFVYIPKNIANKKLVLVPLD